jgi:hypothetical protein
MTQPQDAEAFIAEQKRILKDSPECASTSYNLGVGLLKEGKLDEAEEAFYDAIDNSGRMFEGSTATGRPWKSSPATPGGTPTWGLPICS